MSRLVRTVQRLIFVPPSCDSEGLRMLWSDMCCSLCHVCGATSVRPSSHQISLIWCSSHRCVQGRLCAGVCLPVQEALLAGETAAAAAALSLNYLEKAGLLVCLFQHWPTTPTPSSITVASTLVLKPVCSSSGCKSFQALVVPLFLHLSPLSLPFPSLFSCSQLQHLQLPSSCCSPQKWKDRGGCGQEQTWSVSSIFVCHLTRSFLHCWFLQLLLCGNGAPTGRYCTLPEQTFSSLPLKCPFCMSSWKNGAFCCPTT